MLYNESTFFNIYRHLKLIWSLASLLFYKANILYDVCLCMCNMGLYDFVCIGHALYNVPVYLCLWAIARATLTVYLNNNAIQVIPSALWG